MYDVRLDSRVFQWKTLQEILSNKAMSVFMGHFEFVDFS